ncbi:helix-turn-helix domain-containing protein [Lacrimispora brassicae]
MSEKKDINVHIGKQIKIAREAAGYIQDDFAEMIGMSPKNLSAIERGVVGASVSMIKKICNTLSIPSDFLLMSEPDPVDAERLDFLIKRMEHLSPEEFDIAFAIMNNLFKAFNLEHS